jgi:hypothetical protein
MLLQRGRKTLAGPLNKRNNIINAVRVTTCVSFVWACTLYSTVMHKKQYVVKEGMEKGEQRGTGWEGGKGKKGGAEGLKLHK